LSSREFSLAVLEKKKVACVPGGAFGPSGEGYVRCCYATSLEQIKEAMSRIGDFVNEVRKRNAAPAPAPAPKRPQLAKAH
jgi:aminotransferase